MPIELETLLMIKNYRAQINGISERYVIRETWDEKRFIDKKTVFPLSLCCNASTEYGKYRLICSNCFEIYRGDEFSDCCNVKKDQDGEWKFCTKCGLEDDEPVGYNYGCNPKEKELPTRVKNYVKLFESFSSESIVGLKMMLKFHHNFEEKTGKKDLAGKLKLEKKKEEKEIGSEAWLEKQKPTLTKEQKMMLSEEEKKVLQKEKAVKRKKNFEKMSKEDQKISKIRAPLMKNVLYYILEKFNCDDIKSKIPLPKKPTVKLQDSLLKIQEYLYYNFKTQKAKSETKWRNEVCVKQSAKRGVADDKTVEQIDEKKPKTIIDDEEKSGDESETESEKGIDFDDFEDNGDIMDELENPEKYFDVDDLINNSDSDSDSD